MLPTTGRKRKHYSGKIKMKIEKIKANINGTIIEKALSDGINFIFYQNAKEKTIYEKLFQLVVDKEYFEDDYYKDNDIYVCIELSDDISYKLIYDNQELDIMAERLFIENKSAPVYHHEISKGLIENYIKKNGYIRTFFYGGDMMPTDTPKGILDGIMKKAELSDLMTQAGLLDYIRNIEPVFVNTKKDCRLLLLANGSFYIEGENEDDEEQCALKEYFKFVITAKLADRTEELEFCANNYPLFVSGLFEAAGKSLDIEAVLKILEDYYGQTVFFCPEEFRSVLSQENVVKLVNEINENILPF